MVDTPQTTPMNGSGSTPRPDPTVLTMQAIERAIEATEKLRESKLDVLRERLDAIDKATTLLATGLEKTPAEIQRVMDSLRALAWERFDSVQTQFKERDIRQERESRDNKVAVDAAFAAQKEAAVKQDESNEKSILKSERATNDAIAQMGELMRTGFAGVGDKIDDLKDRVGKTETSVVALTSVDIGAKAQKTDQRGAGNYIIAIAGAVVGLLGITLAIIGFIVSSGK